jgi:CheY-like chemotaxis protein
MLNFYIPLVRNIGWASGLEENIVRAEHSRVLLAEDNELNRKVMLAMLKRLGYRADIASNGIGVLRALEHRRYYLILMNVGMPVMDGIEATREIRRVFPDGPKIVAVTAYALPGMREKCIEAGMDDYITKPVRVNELGAVLTKYSVPKEGLPKFMPVHARNTRKLIL